MLTFIFSILMAAKDHSLIQDDVDDFAHTTRRFTFHYQWVSKERVKQELLIHQKGWRHLIPTHMSKFSLDIYFTGFDFKRVPRGESCLSTSQLFCGEGRKWYFTVELSKYQLPLYEYIVKFYFNKS